MYSWIRKTGGKKASSIAKDPERCGKMQKSEVYNLNGKRNTSCFQAVRRRKETVPLHLLRNKSGGRKLIPDTAENRKVSQKTVIKRNKSIFDCV